MSNALLNLKPAPKKILGFGEIQDKEPVQKSEPPPLPPSGGQTPSAPPSIPASPERDFNKRANSLDRDALPAGLFPGSSKRIYDALYLRTRGAVKPTRTIRATKRDLIEWSGIRNRKTLDAHIRYLSACGLLERKWELGSTDGYLFEIKLPEETPLGDRGGQGDRGTDQKRDRGTDQKRDRGGQSQIIENTTSSANPNTYKTTTNTDDEVFALLVKKFSDLTKEVTGMPPSIKDRERWEEMAEIIIKEFQQASSNTETISSVPGFLAAHLKRRFTRQQKEAPARVKKDEVGKRIQATPQSMTSEEKAEVIEMIIEMITTGNYTIDQAKNQFASGLEPDDWLKIEKAKSEKSI